MKDGTKLIYIREDAGLITDNGVFLAPGEENVVEVGKHLNGEQADAFVKRGWCEVYEPAATDRQSSMEIATLRHSSTEAATLSASPAAVAPSAASADAAGPGQAQEADAPDKTQ